MIECSNCMEWYHLDCIGMKRSEVPKRREKFFCKDCKVCYVKQYIKLSLLTIKLLVTFSKFSPT